MVDGVDGLIILWAQSTRNQGLRRFGLIATGPEIEQLAGSNGGHFRLSDLHLMLIVPLGTQVDPKTRTWFRSVKDFRY